MTLRVGCSNQSAEDETKGCQSVRPGIDAVNPIGEGMQEAVAPESNATGVPKAYFKPLVFSMWHGEVGDATGTSPLQLRMLTIGIAPTSYFVVDQIRSGIQSSSNPDATRVPRSPYLTVRVSVPELVT